MSGGGPRETVGFLGLGVMGAPMAENLAAAGFDVIAWNRSAAAHERINAPGVRVATDLAAVTAEAGIAISVLSDDAAVREVLGREAGVISTLAPGSLAIDMSTISPRLAREARRRRGRARGRIPRRAGQRWRRWSPRGHPNRDGRGRHGGPGAGPPALRGAGLPGRPRRRGRCRQSVKACNQVLVAAIVAGLSEALVFGSKLGIETEAIIDVLSGGMAANRVLEVRRSSLLEHTFEPGFKVDLHHKDLGIALGAAGEAGVSLPLTAAVQQMFNQLRANGYGDEDNSALLRVAEAAANSQI